MLCSDVFAEDAIPTRVVCLAPSYVETLIELRLTKGIVGVTSSSDYLEKVKHVERVGLYMKPNIEKIVSLKPDLVLATDFIGQKSAVEKLRGLDVRVVVFDMQRMEDISTMTEKVGALFRVQKRSQRLLSRMQEIIQETKIKTNPLSKPRVYVETGYDPLFTCGKGSFIHDLIQIAGGENIAGNIDNPFPRITIPSPRLILYGLPELLKRIHPEIVKEAKDKKDNE